MLTASFRKSELSWPGNCFTVSVSACRSTDNRETGKRTRRQVVIPDMTKETKWFKSP
jgi:hypothetical protein